MRAAIAIGVGIVLLGGTIVAPPRPRMLWNASPSAPVGLYAVEPGVPVNAGDMVIAQVPAGFRKLAAERHYIPANVPLVKRVAATAGNQVCALGSDLFLDGGWLADRRPTDAGGRPMPWWQGCVRLHRGQLFLLMTGKKASFDGRYFGVTGSADIIGKAQLLWPR